MSKFFSLLFGFISIIFFALVFKVVYVEISQSNIPFDTDEADHANPSLELYTAVKSGSIPAVYESIVRQAFYPPAFSFLVAGNYFISGPSFPSSRIPALFCFVLYTASIFFLTYTFLKEHTEPETCLITSFLTAVAAVTSPITINNSSLCMLELPGILSVTACMIFFSIGKDRLALLASLLVFFTKYNFGIITIPALILSIWFTKSFKKAFLSGCAVLAALLLWAMLTYRDSFFHFFVGHKSYAPLLSSENLFFEINSWLNLYAVNYQVAATLLLLALIGFLKYKDKPAVIFAALNTFFSFFVLALSSTNEERHFMVALPGILFLSGLGLSVVFGETRKKISIFASYALLSIFMINFYQEIPELQTKLRSQYEGEAGFFELFKTIYDNTTADKPILLYGVSDSFSIEALRWYFASHSGKPYTAVSLDAYPYRSDKNFTARMRKRNLDKPFQDKNFPKKPLQAILDKHYYAFAVNIFNKEKKQKFSKEGDELKLLLGQNLIANAAAGSHEIEVYKP